ncbi:MAG: hypothetical protein ACK5XP_01715 [Sphingobacteriia bacterium]
MPREPVEGLRSKIADPKQGKPGKHAGYHCKQNQYQGHYEGNCLFGNICLDHCDKCCIKNRKSYRQPGEDGGPGPIAPQAL